MKITENDAVKIVNAKKEGEAEEWYGPFTVGPVRIFELWVWFGAEGDDASEDDGEYHIRFVTQIEANAPDYFPTFASLCEYLNGLNVTAARLGHDAGRRDARGRNESHLEKVRIYVAAFVFVASVAALLLLLVFRHSSDGSQALTALTGLLASGAAFFFGKWIPGGAGRSDN